MINSGLLPEAALWWSAVLSLLLLIPALVTYNWHALLTLRGAQHFFFGSVVALTLLWNMQAGILPGLSFHLMGVTAITLMMGWRLALLSVLLVQIILVLVEKLWWVALPYQFLLAGALPVLFSYRVIPPFLTDAKSRGYAAINGGLPPFALCGRL